MKSFLKLLLIALAPLYALNNASATHTDEEDTDSSNHQHETKPELNSILEKLQANIRNMNVQIQQEIQQEIQQQFYGKMKNIQVHLKHQEHDESHPAATRQ